MLTILLIFCFFRNEEIITEKDNSDSFKHVLMYFNKLFSNIFELDTIYTLVKGTENSDVIAWCSKNKSELLDNYSIIDSYNKRNKGSTNFIYEKDKDKKLITFYIDEININDNYTILFFTNKEIKHDIKKYIFECINSFILKHIDKLIISKKNNDNIIYNPVLELNYNKLKDKQIFLFNPKFNRTKLNILHLSDLHIKSEQGKGFANKFLANYYKTKLKDKNSKEFKSDIDFIVITGDAINAGNSSNEILNNYIEALKNIEIIAKSILGNIWRKRLIVIPGNHDYGMISELKIDIVDRSYNYSYTTNIDTREHEKFIFFHLLFDGILLNNNYILGTDANFKDNLYYLEEEDKEKTKIHFYQFNTACKANAIRSNKVYLELPKELNDLSKDDISLFFMHHTPLFSIDYYIDIFAKILNNDEKYKELIFGHNEDEKIYLLNYKTSQNEISDMINKYNKQLNEIKNTKEIKENQEKINKINFIIGKNNEILKYFMYSDFEDETCVTAKQKLLLFFEKSQEDSKKYCDSIERLNKHFGKMIILGGHRHMQAYAIEENRTIYEVGRTIEKKEEQDKNDSKIIIETEIFNYGVLSLNISKDYYSTSNYYASEKMNDESNK